MKNQEVDNKLSAEQNEELQIKNILQQLTNNSSNLSSEDSTKLKELVNDKLLFQGVKKISTEVQNHIKEIQHEDLESFKKVRTMYYSAFWVGISLIIAGFVLAGITITSANVDTEENKKSDITGITGVLAGIFGAGGILDITILLFRPARDLQRSRASASQLAMAANEWQFISIWSGKVVGILFKKLESSNYDLKYINSIQEVLTLKEKLCSNLMEAIEKFVANENIHEDKSNNSKTESKEITYDVTITDQTKLKQIEDWVTKVNQKANETCTTENKEFIKISNDKKQIIAKFDNEKEKKCITDSLNANKDEAEKIDSEFYKKLMEKFG